ncbi:MAG: adenylate kinase [Clostridia bacterium]|nr:adenylate kinase [Clostridia bacterium]
MKIILLGAPGSGKGTLANQIIKDFDIPQISTGQLFRNAIKDRTELGIKIESTMASGSLVPDEITIAVLQERLKETDCKNGFILDGFPRNIAQAKALEDITKIDAIIFLDVDEQTVISRLSTRRTCPSCGGIYNTNSYAGSCCEKCGAKLIQRDDDKPESIKNRLEVYENMTSPLINFYGEKLFKVFAGGSPEETYRLVKTYLDSLEAINE